MSGNVGGEGPVPPSMTLHVTECADHGKATRPELELRLRELWQAFHDSSRIEFDLRSMAAPAVRHAARLEVSLLREIRTVAGILLCDAERRAFEE